MPVSRSHWIAAASVFVLVAALYFPSLRGGFVYDSRGQVLYTDYIHTPSHWGDVLSLRVLSQDVLDRNRPLLLASLMLDAALWEREPFGYRLTSVLLHSANAAMLFLLVVAGFGRSPGPTVRVSTVGAAIFGALVFALHPLVVEVVAEPSNREDELVLAAVLSGLLVILRCGSQPSRRWLGINALLVGAAFLAVAAKESGVAALPPAIASLMFARGNSGNLRPACCWRGPRRSIRLASYAWRPAHSVVFAVSPQPWLRLVEAAALSAGFGCADSADPLHCLLSADYPGR